MAPRADFSCLSGRCDKKGRLVTYELPITATRCPVCGSKKIKRLYNRIGVLRGRRPDHLDPRHTSSSHAARTDALVEGPINGVLAKRDELKASQRRAAGPPGTRWDGDMGMVQAVPARALPQKLQQLYAGHQGAPVVDQRALTQKATVGGSLSGDSGEMVNRMTETPMPKRIEARDTEFKIVKGRDGNPEVGRA